MTANPRIIGAPLAKKSTRATVPSLSLAVADKVSDAGALNDAPFDGLVSVTLGALFVAAETGPLAGVGQFTKRIAGADLNVAIGLARLGFKVGWMSRVGADSFGQYVRDTLTREGIDQRCVSTDARYPTGFQLKSKCDDGSDPAVEYFRKGSAAVDPCSAAETQTEMTRCWSQEAEKAERLVADSQRDLTDKLTSARGRPPRRCSDRAIARLAA